MRAVLPQSCVLAALVSALACSPTSEGVGGIDYGGADGRGGSTTSGGAFSSGGTSSGGSTGQNTWSGGHSGVSQGTGGGVSGGTSSGTGGQSRGGSTGNTMGGSRNGGPQGGSAGRGSLGSGGMIFGMAGRTGNGGSGPGNGGSGPGNGGSGPGIGGRSGGGGMVNMGNGGTPSTGGTSSGGGGVSTTCTEANKTVSSNGIGTHCGYTYEYWKDSGSGTLTLKPDGFSVEWSGINDLLGRKGMRPGSGNLVVNYEANYQPNGNSYLCIYGWTKSPLVEYYIVDSWGNWRPPGGQGHVGTVTSDGGTYDIYKISKSGPNIEGNGSFTQYWSVRTDKKTSGTITVANHFNAWKNNGMPMGSFYEVSMTVEGYQSSGKADVKFSMK